MTDIYIGIAVTLTTIIVALILALLVHRYIHKPIFEIKEGKMESDDYPEIAEAINERMDAIDKISGTSK